MERPGGRLGRKKGIKKWKKSQNAAADPWLSALRGKLGPVPPVPAPKMLQGSAVHSWMLGRGGKQAKKKQNLGLNFLLHLPEVSSDGLEGVLGSEGEEQVIKSTWERFETLSSKPKTSLTKNPVVRGRKKKKKSNPKTLRP